MKFQKILDEKYKSKKSKCLSGHSHKSRGEAGHCNALMADKQSGRIKDYETEKKIELRVNGVLICNHYVDFWIHENNGTFRVDEFKGAELAVWIIKMRLFIVLFPDIPYNVIKEQWRDNRWLLKKIK